ncbi:leucine-rich repeat protein [Phocaeicola sp.]
MRSKLFEIPEGVTSTGADTLAWCTNLKEISLPSTFTTIDRSMFSECSALETITWPIAEGVNVSGITISGYAFDNASSNFKIKVPSSKLDAMKNKFSKLEDHFEAIETTP